MIWVVTVGLALAVTVLTGVTANLISRVHEVEQRIHNQALALGDLTLRVGDAESEVVNLHLTELYRNHPSRRGQVEP